MARKPSSEKVKAGARSGDKNAVLSRLHAALYPPGRIAGRFHGTSGRYAGDYPESLLRDWAGWLKDQARSARAIYAYFNNDTHGNAVKNAKQLREFL